MPKTCIQICTFDRPAMLRKLLAALIAQAQDCQIVVVDNGTVPSEAVVAEFKASLSIVYDRLIEPGLVFARNRALSLALAFKPEFLVFIDDDEVPEVGWLANLVARLEQTGAGFACGPVLPEYLAPPPRWVTEGEFFHASGETFCTSNLIMRTACLPADKGQWFQKTFNLSGGEDYEFLGRLAAQGARHVVAEAAVVREHIPASRMRRRYVWRRGLRDGVAIAQIIASKDRSRPAIAMAVLQRAVEKTGYGLNHLFWSVTAPWRVHRAVADFAAAGGIVLRSLGFKFAFYGQPAKKALEQRPELQ